MAYTSGQYHLSNLLQDAYRNLGQYQAHVLSGAPTTTTAIVAGLAGKDSLEEGTMFCIETTDAEAPEGEYRRITAYVSEATIGTFTVDAFSASLTAKDRVAVVTELYPVETMVELANGAMKKLGDIVVVDTTTLDADSNKTEYALEIAAKRNLLRVDQQGRTGDANDNQWYTIYNVETVPALPGVAGKMILPQLIPGRDLRYWYMDAHPRLSEYGDFIDEVINPELAAAALTVVALRWQKMRQDTPQTAQDLNYWEVELSRLQQIFPIKRPRRKARFITLPRGGGNTGSTGGPNRVRL